MDYFTAILEKYPGITENDFELRNDGQGIYISRWDWQDPEPRLLDLEQRAIYLGEYHEALNKRLASYPPIGDQLDAILKQLQAEPTKVPELQEIITKWEAVKTTYPKPIEPTKEIK